MSKTYFPYLNKLSSIHPSISSISKILGSPDPGDSKHGTSLPHRPGGVQAIAGGAPPGASGPVTYYTAHNGDSLQAAPGVTLLAILLDRHEISAMF